MKDLYLYLFSPIGCEVERLNFRLQKCPIALYLSCSLAPLLYVALCFKTVVQRLQ